ncbi:malto-oligosyltrehalose trehalohydrolase, partial [Pseudomonas syringae]
MRLRTDDNWRHGAVLWDPEHPRFALWAPDASSVSAEMQYGQSLAMLPQSDGWFVLEARCKAGTRYRFRLDHELDVPDPASRAQLADVHSESLVVDPDAYSWQHTAWTGRPWHQAVIYEVPVAPLGVYAAVVSTVPRPPTP